MTIHQLFQNYLQEQKKRLAPKTFSSYEWAIELLEHCCDSYGSLDLNQEQDKLLETAIGQGKEAGELFGPEVLTGSLFSTLVGNYLPRKVMCGYDTAKRMCGAAVHCYKWLCRHGYMNDDDPNQTARELRENFEWFWQEFNDGSDYF